MSEINEVKELISQTKGAVGIMTKVSLLEYFITTIESQNSQIESLKAITELAVKGLEWYSDRNNYGRIYTAPDDSELYSAADSDQGIKARTTLSEIEELQNGTS